LTVDETDIVWHVLLLFLYYIDQAIFFEILLFYSYAICPLYINLLYNLPPYGIIEWSLQQAAMLIF